MFSNCAIIKGKACYDAVHKNGHLGRTTIEMVGKQIFFSGQEKNKNKTKQKKKTEAAFCMLLLLILSTRWISLERIQWKWLQLQQEVMEEN